jgi:two-component system chemotaxis response regulator CheY
MPLVAENVSIVVAEDDSAALTLILHTLRDMGYMGVDPATHGLMAIATAKKKPIDVMILDWDLARLDGAHVVQYLRRVPGMRLPKFIMMISAAKREIIEQARDIGVDATLIKPFTAATLRDKLQTVLNG